MTNEQQAYYLWKLYRIHRTICWKEVVKIHPLQGHGVEFIHVDFGKVPMVFLKGYEWKDNPQRKVKAEIVRHDSKIFAGGTTDTFPVLEDLTEAVIYFLLTPSAQTQDIHVVKVQAWFNRLAALPLHGLGVLLKKTATCWTRAPRHS